MVAKRDAVSEADEVLSTASDYLSSLMTLAVLKARWHELNECGDPLGLSPAVERSIQSVKADAADKRRTLAAFVVEKSRE